MSRTTQILLTVLVLIFSIIMCPLALSDPSALGSAGGVVGVIVALALTVAAWFALGALAKVSAAQQDKQAHAILDPHLPVGETYQAMMYGYIGPGQVGMVVLFGYLGDWLINSWRRKWHYIGLTDRHLVVLPVSGNRPTGDPRVIGRNEVQQLELKGLQTELVIALLTDKLAFKIAPGWQEQAKAMDKAWRGVTV